MAGVGFYMIAFLKKKEADKTFEKFNKWRRKLKTHGTVIEVDFDKCTLKSNKYREEIIDDTPSHQYMALDLLIDRDNREYNHVDQSVIVFETDLNGEKVTFYSPLINKEKTTLQFLLLDKKSTKIYVDKSNRNNYYFDVEFLYPTIF